MFKKLFLKSNKEDEKGKGKGKEERKKTMNHENISMSQSVAILIDGNNIERSLQSLTGKDGVMLNFDLIIPRLLDKRALNRLVYFREGKRISTKLADRLHNYYFGSVIPCHKSADIPLSIMATQLSEKVDTIIIMSGDSDYIELIRHLKSKGVRIEIAAVSDTTAQILIDESHYFHPLTRDDWFILPSAIKKKSRPNNKKRN